MTRNPTKVRRTAAKKAASMGVPLAVVDVRKDEPEYVKLSSLASFMASPRHRGARFLYPIYPEVQP